MYTRTYTECSQREVVSKIIWYLLKAIIHIDQTLTSLHHYIITISRYYITSSHYHIITRCPWRQSPAACPRDKHKHQQHPPPSWRHRPHQRPSRRETSLSLSLWQRQTFKYFLSAVYCSFLAPPTRRTIHLPRTVSLAGRVFVSQLICSEVSSDVVVNLRLPEETSCLVNNSCCHVSQGKHLYIQMINNHDDN